MTILRAQHLTPAAFAPFGRVAAAGNGPERLVNDGTARRYDPPGCLDHLPPASRPVLAVYRSRPRQAPVEVPLLERHPHSSQTFVPLGGARWLVVVARDPAAPAAFLASGGQAVTYARGVWHSPLIALDRTAELVMLMWESLGGDDTELLPLDPPLTVLEP